MPDQRHVRGLIDTSVVIALEVIEYADLPVELAVSAGLPLYTRNPDEFAGLSGVLEIIPV